MRSGVNNSYPGDGHKQLTVTAWGSPPCCSASMASTSQLTTHVSSDDINAFTKNPGTYDLHVAQAVRVIERELVASNENHSCCGSCCLPTHSCSTYPLPLHWCLYGLDYVSAYACFHDTHVGQYAWSLVPCNELSLFMEQVSRNCCLCQRCA
jgi:hypothetical protein